MVRAFWSVIVDLWYFLWGLEPLVDLHRGIEATTTPLTLPQATFSSPVLIPPPQHPVLLTSTITTLVDGATPGVSYVVLNPHGTLLYQQSHVAFDSVLRNVPYGQLMTFRRFVGSYAEVLVFGQVGFVKKDDITPRIEDVWPQFVSGVVYDATHQSTLLARAHLNDSFLGGILQLPLTAVEYVTLRLLRDRLSIPWPPVRPRPAGQWHIILRGTHGVHSGVSPQTDSLIEWIADDGEGKIGYVETVLRDNTIKVSAVGVVVPGEYTESIIPAAVWREWRPVFISIR